MSKKGLVVFAFGCPTQIYANQILANMAHIWTILNRGPVYTQADIQLHAPTTTQVRSVQQLPDQPPPTLRIAREAVAWAKNDRLDELHVLAAAPHLSRCLRDLAIAKYEKHSLVSLREAEIPAEYVPFNDWFCEGSTQPRTRSSGTWRRRERIVRRLPVWLYKLVAS